MSQCESCVYYNYDEEFNDYLCDAEMDEDDVVRYLSSREGNCPFWRPGDEYRTARKQ